MNKMNSDIDTAVKTRRSSKNSRHRSRELALQYLFALDFHEEIASKIVHFDGFPGYDESELASIDEETAVYARYLIEGTLEERVRIDQIISSNSFTWEIGKINRVDRNILRLSVFSLIHTKDIHPAVVIDEAVKLSQEYSNDISYRFINGILDAIRKQIL